jgi:hypothetical protein
MKMEKDYSLEEMIKKYKKIDSKRLAGKKAFEEKDAKLRKLLDILRSKFTEILSENNVESIKTTEGTIIKRDVIRYTIVNNQIFNDFVIENKELGLVENRPHQSNIKQYISENPDNYPHGIHEEKTLGVTIRKSA